MAFLSGDFLAIPAAVFNLFSSAKRPDFSVSGAWQGSDIPFEMSRTHYFTLQNYHKTTDKQSKIRVFCFAHPTPNTNFAETFRDRAVVCSDFGHTGNFVIQVSDLDGNGLKGQKRQAQGKRSGTLGIACWAVAPCKGKSFTPLTDRVLKIGINHCYCCSMRISKARLMLLPFQGATALTRGTQGVASLALG